MTVVAAFSADVTSGASPLTVTFSDDSTGNPDTWHWVFGDGFTSSEQNPVHEYTEDGTYTVSLKAWINTGITTRIPSESNREQRSGGEQIGMIPAHDAFISAPWIPTGLHENLYRVTKITSTKFLFSAARRTLTFDFSSDSGKIIILQAKYNTGLTASSVFTSSGGGSLPNPSGNIYTDWIDTSMSGGSSLVLDIQDGSGYVILSEPININDQNGWRIATDAFLGVKGIVHSFSSQDTETKIDFIGVGVDAPVAGFSGTPRKKQNSLNCQLTDESTNTPTSWSWKRRPSGIDAPYVEFSTDENPNEGFNITDPTP